MRNIAPFAVVVLVALPQAAFAQVVISEFMYDAPGADSGQEWVELFNAGGTPVDLTKWKINDGSNHLLNVPPKNGGIGSIVIAPGAYLILADNAANFEAAYPGVQNVIDTSLSLPNTSGVVSLIDDAGAIADSLSYSKDLGAAGDGETLNRSSLSATTLSAAAPSPGTGTFTAASSPGAGTASESVPEEASSSAPPPAPLPPQAVSVRADTSRDAIAHADTDFEAVAYDGGGKRMDLSDVQFSWAFGDGGAGVGTPVSHHWDEPGRYLVVVEATEGAGGSSARFVVQVRPLSASLLARGGALLVTNTSDRDLDLSDWHLRGRGLAFTIPEHTIILPGVSVAFPREITHLVAEAGEAALLYPNGAVALLALDATTTPRLTIAPALPAKPSDPPPPATRRLPAPPSSRPPSAPLPSPPSSPGAQSHPPAELSKEAQAASVSATHPSLWWFGAFSFALIGGLALAASRRLRSREWDVVEEGPE